MENYINFDPKIIGAILGSTAILGILVLIYSSLPLLFVELRGEPVNYKDADYPKNSFEYLENSNNSNYAFLEKIGFDTETGKISGLKTAKRAKIYALSSAQTALILQWLPAKGSNENKSKLSSGELNVIYNCSRRSNCGNSEDFEPFNAYLIRNSLRQVVSVGGLKAIRDSKEDVERFNHWIDRSKYYDKLLFSNYEMQPTEVAYLTPKFVISVGNKESNLKINGKVAEMNRRGYMSFYRHNLSTGIHKIEISGEEKKLKFHKNIPKILYYKNRIFLDKEENESFKFEKVIISTEENSKTVNLDFKRNKSWIESYTSNPSRRMQIPFNGSTDNMNVTLAHPELNYTEKMETEHNDIENLEREILGLTEEEMKTYNYLINLTGANPEPYQPKLKERETLEK